MNLVHMGRIENAIFWERSMSDSAMNGKKIRKRMERMNLITKFNILLLK